jgi:hypothetical protein
MLAPAPRRAPSGAWNREGHAPEDETIGAGHLHSKQCPAVGGWFGIADDRDTAVISQAAGAAVS